MLFLSDFLFLMTLLLGSAQHYLPHGSFRAIALFGAIHQRQVLRL